MNILKNIPKSVKKLYPHILPIYAKGSYIYTDQNKKYLDYTSGIGALSTGHNHPYIIDKVKDQLGKYVHIPQQIFKSHPIQIELTEKIINTMPNNELDNIFYVSSGSEATDNVIKIARKYTGKSNIICMNNGFHGRTIAALSVTSSNLSCKKDITPLLSNIFYCPDFTIESINKILEYQSSPDNTAAIFLEPIQGEGGIHLVDTIFMKYIERICNEHNILLIADEVQCGAMRTGTWWTIEQMDIIPDLMTFGKGIASGYPLAGVIGKSDIMNTLEVGSLGGTYGGNAICSAAASATIDILSDENIKQHIEKSGKYMKDNLEELPIVKSVRQYGLMIGIEFEQYYDIDVSRYILDELEKENILVLLAGNNNQYIRILPPLLTTKEEVELFVTKFIMVASSLGNVNNIIYCGE